MHPVLLASDRLIVYSYGPVLVLATALAVAWGARAARARLGLGGWQYLELALLVVTCGVATSRIALRLVGTAPPGAAALGRSAGVLQAGVVGGLLVAVAWIRNARLAVLPVLDGLVPAVPLGAAVGRLGCLAAGCCYGRETASPLGMVYVEPAAHMLTGVPLGVKLHPAPVYAAVVNLVVFLILAAWLRRAPAAGAVLAGYLVLDGLSRVLLDRFRGDPRGQLAALHPAEWLGLGMAAAGIVLALAIRRRAGD